MRTPGTTALGRVTEVAYRNINHYDKHRARGNRESHNFLHPLGLWLSYRNAIRYVGIYPVCLVLDVRYHG